MGASSRGHSIYRSYRKLFQQIRALLDRGLIERQEFDELLNRAKQMRENSLGEWKTTRPAATRGRGRPMATDDRRQYKTCKRTGCGKPPARGQAYCSKECAPLADYGLTPRRIRSPAA